MDADLIVQGVELEALPDQYDRKEFISTIETMTNEEFNRFCRQIRHLMHRYSLSAKGFVTRNKAIVGKHPDEFIELPLIDWDQPIFFRRER